MRWSLRLAEFDFDIEHRPGTQIRHADSLSRHVHNVTANQTLSKELVKAEQETDKFCKLSRGRKTPEKVRVFLRRRRSHIQEAKKRRTPVGSPQEIC